MTQPPKTRIRTLYGTYNAEKVKLYLEICKPVQRTSDGLTRKEHFMKNQPESGRRAYFTALVKQADGGKDRSRSRQKKKGRKK